MIGSVGGGASEVGQSLEDVIRLLGQAPGADGSDSEAVRGIGTAADEAVRAEVSACGRLESLSVDPRLLRSGTTAIAEYVLEAVRAAQDDAQRQSSQLLGGVAGGFDPARLSAGLQQVATDAARSFERMVGDLDAVTRRLEGR